jgi:hypothetical protein
LEEFKKAVETYFFWKGRAKKAIKSYYKGSAIYQER